MPIKIDGGLSAVNRLREEGIVTIGKDRAMTQDIRPLKILILNLMPLKKPTELQLLRLLGNSPIQIEIDFCRPVSRVSTHTDNSYLDRVYLEWNDIKDRYYDGFIITGAPVEKIDFEDVEYWPELVQYFEWARSSRNFTIPTMTAVSSPASSGAAMLTCFTPIGSIWSIRKRPMTCCS